MNCYKLSIIKDLIDKLIKLLDENNINHKSLEYGENSILEMIDEEIETEKNTKDNYLYLGMKELLVLQSLLKPMADQYILCKSNRTDWRWYQELETEYNLYSSIVKMISGTAGKLYHVFIGCVTEETNNFQKRKENDVLFYLKNVAHNTKAFNQTFNGDELEQIYQHCKEIMESKGEYDN